MRRLLACLLPLAALVAAPLATAEECVRGVPAPPPELPPRPVAEPKLHDFATGAGVTVAVIDTGIHPHPELLHLEPGHDVTNAAVSDPHHDCDGHGTAVAGIIATQTSGIAPDARIVPIRQTTAYARMPAGHGDEGEGTLASLTAAIHLALDEGADIINVSVVACTDAEVDDHELNEALRRAEEDNAVIVAAAGNRTTDCHDHATVYPTHAPTVIGVQATQGSAEAAEYSLTLPPGSATPERSRSRASGFSPG
ncbi:hypothetical protein C3B44_02075 [Corynebacterium yudongzhengii]|uniref:Peptidase S8/S53 domain-containing protein n=1 Tax=Corynebacterium yudongzhengii TaxID=2080740 RepID=A0A2U1T9Y2_9CORY|nr:hypothetical protein C3B44_02075 [Corynebacterium yudongzhengii]PWC02820.1 hypothetical protein DF222_00805 [Corynebacterium yudongzhengii]